MGDVGVLKALVEDFFVHGACQYDMHGRLLSQKSSMKVYLDDLRVVRGGLRCSHG